MVHRILLIALSAALTAGYAATRADSATGGKDAEGAKVFSQHCAACHGPGGKGTSVAPSLEAVKDRQLVIKMVTNGRGIMPSFANKLSPVQIQAAADYVTSNSAKVSLKGGNLSRGGVLFRDRALHVEPMRLGLLSGNDHVDTPSRGSVGARRASSSGNERATTGGPNRTIMASAGDAPTRR